MLMLPEVHPVSPLNKALQLFCWPDAKAVSMKEAGDECEDEDDPDANDAETGMAAAPSDAEVMLVVGTLDVGGGGDADFEARGLFWVERLAGGGEGAGC